MINMHERNQAWVDAAKTYERFLEEFAANDNYPFEQHEDALNTRFICSAGKRAEVAGRVQKRCSYHSGDSH